MTPDEGQWTFATLLKHVMHIIEANDRRYEQRFVDSQTAVAAALAAVKLGGDAQLTATKEAVSKAEIASDKRFEGVNEFRAALADQQRTLMPRQEAELRFNAIDAHLSKLDAGSSERRGHVTGGRELWAWIVGALGAAALLWKFFAGGPP